MEIPIKKEVYEPTDRQVGEGAYYDLREIKAWNECHDAFTKYLESRELDVEEIVEELNIKWARFSNHPDRDKLSYKPEYELLAQAIASRFIAPQIDCEKVIEIITQSKAYLSVLEISPDPKQERAELAHSIVEALSPQRDGTDV